MFAYLTIFYFSLFHSVFLDCWQKNVSKNLLAFRQKKYIAFPPSFWCVCATGKQKSCRRRLRTEEGNADVGDNDRTRSCKYSSSIICTCTHCTYFLSRASRCSKCSVPGTWYWYKQTTNRLQNQRYGVCLARKNFLWAGTTSLRRFTSRTTPFSFDGEGEAQFPYGTWIHCEAPPCCVESAELAG